MLGLRTGLEKIFLFYFHNMVTATGPENLESLMKAELTADVFSESLVPGSVSDETAVTPTTKKHQFNRNKRKGPPYSKKKRTDYAILRYVSRNERQDSTGGSLTSSRSGFSTLSTAKDDYIREKKRIAGEIFDMAMANEINNAVHTSLKKRQKMESPERIICCTLQPRRPQTYISLHYNRVWQGQMQERNKDRRNVLQ
jgi:hypothetical protein